MAQSFLAQVQANLVALISLAIAVTGLSYNTWRNERTEANNNVRDASFAMILELGKLQEVVFLSHYDRDAVRGNPRSGWTAILTISDLAMLVPAPVPGLAEELKASWGRDWDRLGEDDAAAGRIQARIDGLRAGIRDALNELE